MARTLVHARLRYRMQVGRGCGVVVSIWDLRSWDVLLSRGCFSSFALLLPTPSSMRISRAREGMHSPQITRARSSNQKSGRRRMPTLRPSIHLVTQTCVGSLGPFVPHTTAPSSHFNPPDPKNVAYGRDRGCDTRQRIGDCQLYFANIYYDCQQRLVVAVAKEGCAGERERVHTRALAAVAVVVEAKLGSFASGGQGCGSGAMACAGCRCENGQAVSGLAGYLVGAARCVAQFVLSNAPSTNAVMDELNLAAISLFGSTAHFFCLAVEE